jgi:flagellar FliJ protein
MKKFNFRLQRVLDIKGTIEEVKRRDFNLARMKHSEEVKTLMELQNQENFFRTKLNETRAKGSNLRQINIFYRFFAYLSGQKAYRRKLIETAREEMEKRREILIEAVKEKKVLERLKEKKLLEYNFELNKEEQANMDEISGVKHSRKTDEEL